LIRAQSSDDQQRTCVGFPASEEATRPKRGSMRLALVAPLRVGNGLSA